MLIQFFDGVQAIKRKRMATDKDGLPDEVFSRVRGELYLGPGFKLTHNKLRLQEDVPRLLEAAIQGWFLCWTISAAVYTPTSEYIAVLPAD